MSASRNKVMRHPHSIHGAGRTVTGRPTRQLVHETFQKAQDMRTVIVAHVCPGGPERRAWLSYRRNLYAHPRDAILNAFVGRPENLVLNAVLVPPICSRPSRRSKIDLVDTLQVNAAKQRFRRAPQQLKTVMDNWDSSRAMHERNMPGLTKAHRNPVSASVSRASKVASMET
ncbi:Aste57867_22297 [Aphanomyces stellatus]|uniref:Aste57867_22297 protein n=1 Tax=Aphanomyces stellatus TaxID=120398 RepID=A0A485LK08_9STRA|nr:hypothetical protein As57867_022227 [Aphanomyces stellatus]VFT98961.1 Aste57867_22297 [Aphanomyces stellatus]